MPAPSFAAPHAADQFVWPPPPPPGRRRKRKPAAGRPADHAVGPSTRQVMVDRFERAVAAGRITLCPDDMPCDSLDMTLAEVALLLEILLPEEFVGGVRAPAPTATAPGSGGRVEAYRRRVAAGESVFGAGDARADGPGRGVRITPRANGRGVRVLGWEGDGDGD